jgi:hypothetical protein
MINKASRHQRLSIDSAPTVHEETTCLTSGARSLLDEARAAVERAQHDESEQAYRETAFDCYD